MGWLVEGPDSVDGGTVIPVGGSLEFKEEDCGRGDV